MRIKLKRVGVLLACLLVLNASAQNVTVNPGNVSYATLGAAFDAINAGTHTGEVTVAINASTTEDIVASLDGSGSGTASYTSVSIYPTVTGLTISGNMATPLIQFYGADNVTLDGRVNGTGTAIDLTLMNSSNSNSGATSTIRFINDATSDTVKYCTIKGSEQSSTSGIILIAGATNYTTGNDNLIISNNAFTNSGVRPINAIYAGGTMAKPNNNVIIRDNNLYNILQNGTLVGNFITILSGNSDFEISANSFYETTSWSPRSSGAIVINIVNSLGSNFNVSNNYIGGSAPLCGGTAWTKNASGTTQINCIYIYANSVTASNIQGNTISNWNYSNALNTRDWTGIAVAGGLVNIGTTTGNTIGAASGQNAITLSNCGSFYGIRASGLGTYLIKNNKIGSITNTTASNTYGIYTAGSGAITMENNTIGSTVTSNSIYASGTSSLAVCGIYASSLNTTSIKGNTIANMANNASTASSLTGILSSGSSTMSTISENFIHDISYTDEGNISPLIGINLLAGTNATLNNIIALGGDNSGEIYGIKTAGGINNIYFNSVYIFGMPSSSNDDSAALYSTAANTRDIRNNIFFSARDNAGATGIHYAAFFGAANTGLTLNNNDYFVTGSDSSLGYYNSTVINTLPEWKAATTMDANSQSIDPSLSSAGGTLTSNYFPSEGTLLAANDTGVTTDYLGVARSAFIPAMGAIEFAIPCINPTVGGNVATAQSGLAPFNPIAFTSSTAASGQFGTIQYKWQSSTTSSTAGFTDIASSNSVTYDAGDLSVTTWFKRLARVTCKSDWIGAAESNVVMVTVIACLPTTSMENATGCDSYSWSENGTTYTTSGMYTNTTTNVLGCTNVATLNLTINYSTSSSTTTTACDSYTWPANGVTYTTSGVYTNTTTNASGCPNVATLNLIINHSTTSSSTVTACDTYTWSENGQGYTTSGVYTNTTNNASGCPNVATLNLTINHSTTLNTTIAACDTYTWSENGQVYTTSGVYTNTTTNGSGCTNVATLHLTVQHSVSYYADADNDGFGNAAVTVQSCSGAPIGYVTNTTDCDDTKSTTHPGAVDVCNDGIDNDCNGIIDNVGLSGGCVPIVSAVIPLQRSTTLALLDDQVFASLVPNAQGYRWRVTKMVGLLPSTVPAEVQIIDTSLRAFRITQLATYAFNTDYQIEVAVRLNAVWQPFYGMPYIVKTPATTTKVLDSQCGTRLTLIADPVYAGLVAYATGYRFRVTNLLTSTVSPTIDRQLREFKFSLFSDITFNTPYKVEVAVRNTDGTYLPYGPSCTITTPLFPTTQLQTSQCDYTAISSTEILYADLVSNATAYRFSFANATTTIVSPPSSLRGLRISSVVGLVPGVYSVQVAIQIAGVWGSYGKSCSLTLSGAAKVTDLADVITIQALVFEAIAYPNPFAANFKLEVTTNSQDNLEVRVYDMIGKQVEDKLVKASDLESFEVGADFPSGVYNVVVIQGEQTKTLRVIKR